MCRIRLAQTLSGHASDRYACQWLLEPVEHADLQVHTAARFCLCLGVVDAPARTVRWEALPSSAKRQGRG